MMTPLKDTLEVAGSVADTSTAPAVEHAKPESAGLRADAVSLEVPVQVHGSRVAEVVRGITPHTEPFEEQTTSMIVFPQGGVLRMSTPVTAGQMMVVTNLKSGHDAICRIVKVRAYAPSQSYVEIEFTNRQRGYWGVQFAGEEIEPAKALAPLPPPPPISTTVRVEASNAAENSPKIAPAPLSAVSVRPAAVKRPEPPPAFSVPAKPVAPPLSARNPQPSKIESSFVAIGAQEEVQPAASTTNFKSKQERTVAPAASLSIAELRGDGLLAAPMSTSLGSGVPGEMTDLSADLEDVTASQQPLQPEPVPSTAVFSPAAAPASPQRVFGARFDALTPAVGDQANAAPSSPTHGFQIATGIAALLVAAAGGAIYLHLWPGAKSSARPESAPPAMSLPAAYSNSSAVPGPATNSAPSPAAQSTPQTPASAASSAPAITLRASDPVIANRAQPVAAPNLKQEKALPDMSVALAAHPVSAQHAASDAGSAPSVDGAESSAGELQQMSSAVNVSPPPPPPARIKVGGDVKSPVLVSSVMPIYPSMAKSTGIAGNVVVQASISPAGIVVATKVLSGPPVLRQAALDAVRRWRYRPAMLNGDPVAVDITVTLAFHN
jgi:periplasmic protein TonB